MRIPNPISTTNTEAYLAYKAGVLAQADLKEKLYHPYIHIDGWLAYWTGLTDTYPTDKNGDPECLTDEEAYIAYLAGVTSEYPEALKDPAAPRMAGYLKYLISARFGRPNYPVTRQELYLSMMKPPVVPSGDPSSSIDLEGTVEAPFISMEMYGDTYQKTYSGKNKMPMATAIMQEDNERQRSFYMALPAGTYTMSYTLSSFELGTNAVFSMFMSLFGAGGSQVLSTNIGSIRSSTSLGRKTITFTISDDATTDRLQNIRIATTQWDNGARATLTDIQIESGSDTAYEPYVGGVPSPNPDYPQAVQTVTGRQVVDVTGGDEESAEYEINLGKNLLQIIGTTSNGLTSSNQNGILKISGEATDNWAFVVPETNSSLSAGEYTLSIDNSLSHSVDVRFYFNDGTNQTYAIGAGNTTTTFATTKSANKYAVLFGGITNGQEYDETIELQLELGSTASEFAPYFEPIELCKIGDYQDYIYRDGEDWYVHKEIGKTLIGELVWQATNSSTAGIYRMESGGLAKIVLRPSSSGVVANMICSHYPVIKANDTYALNMGISLNSSGNLQPYDPSYNTASSFSDFKSWLTDNNVALYYALATSTDTQISNSDLIAQLDALMEGGSYDGETHIRVSATDPNLPALLKVEAAK